MHICGPSTSQERAKPGMKLDSDYSRHIIGEARFCLYMPALFSIATYILTDIPMRYDISLLLLTSTSFPTLRVSCSNFSTLVTYSFLFMLDPGPAVYVSDASFAMHVMTFYEDKPCKFSEVLTET